MDRMAATTTADRMDRIAADSGNDDEKGRLPDRGATEAPFRSMAGKAAPREEATGAVCDACSLVSWAVVVIRCYPPLSCPSCYSFVVAVVVIRRYPPSSCLSCYSVVAAVVVLPLVDPETYSRYGIGAADGRATSYTR